MLESYEEAMGSWQRRRPVSATLGIVGSRPIASLGPQRRHSMSGALPTMLAVPCFIAEVS